jgi:hypothetical protein
MNGRAGELILPFPERAQARGPPNARSIMADAPYHQLIPEFLRSTWTLVAGVVWNPLFRWFIFS